MHASRAGTFRRRACARRGGSSAAPCAGIWTVPLPARVSRNAARRPRRRARAALCTCREKGRWVRGGDVRRRRRAPRRCRIRCPSESERSATGASGCPSRPRASSTGCSGLEACRRRRPPSSRRSLAALLGPALGAHRLSRLVKDADFEVRTRAPRARVALRPRPLARRPARSCRRSPTRFSSDRSR